jgi:hypothetical protein
MSSMAARRFKAVQISEFLDFGGFFLGREYLCGAFLSYQLLTWVSCDDHLIGFLFY